MAFWTNYDPEKLRRSEEQLLEFSGEEVSRETAWLPNGHCIHYLLSGREGAPALVLLHGYCAGGAVFYKIIPLLSKSFRLFCVDLPGMGRSSRPDVSFEYREEAEQFFVAYLEAFRVTVNLETFYLAGHSFGGYVAGCYALAESQRVIALLLISPAGVSSEPLKLPNVADEESFVVRFAKQAVEFFWKRNVTPTAIMRMAGPLSSRLMKVYTRNRLNKIPESELEALEIYLEQLNLMPGSGEKALSVILQPGAWAVNPLWKRLKSSNISMCFLFGEHDWVPSAGAHALAEGYKGDLYISYVTGSSHNIHFDNPEELVEKLLFFCSSI